MIVHVQGLVLETKFWFCCENTIMIKSLHNTITDQSFLTTTSVSVISVIENIFTVNYLYTKVRDNMNMLHTNNIIYIYMSCGTKSNKPNYV